MGYFKRHIDLTKTANNKLDKDVDAGIMAGLNHVDKFAISQDHGCYCSSTISEKSQDGCYGPMH